MSDPRTPEYVRATDDATSAGRRRFRQTLVRVMAVQVVSLLLLWALEAVYTT